MSNSWMILIIMAFTLGLRHGFDLDHLSIIDSITRTISDNTMLAKIIGILFALGHGLVVTLISLVIGSGLFQATAPEWLQGFGNGISLFFLSTFGIITLINVFKNKLNQPITLGMKSLLLQKVLSKNQNPLFVIVIGALFAFSFDTLSQVALFSLSASTLAGWFFSGVLGLVFMIGMMTSDGLNGFLVSTLIARTDKVSSMVSRLVGFIIAMFSLTIALTNLYQLM